MNTTTKPKDLGTYYTRVEFEGGDGFIYQWNTGGRYTNGMGSCSPLNAQRINPNWENEEDLAGTMLFIFTEGNYACDCNRRIFLDQAHQIERPDDFDPPCGDEIKLQRLTMIRPDGSEKILFP